MARGVLYLDQNQAPPTTLEELNTWRAQATTAKKVSLLGGKYWLYAEVSNLNQELRWVIDPNGSLIENIKIYVFYPKGGQILTLNSGYHSDAEYFMHYGKRLALPSGEAIPILIQFSSPFFASIPNFDLHTEADYNKQVTYENIITLFCFSALLTLALYNFFIYLVTRDQAQLYYSSYLVIYFIAWAFTFHFFKEIFNWQNLNLHYIAFFLLPVINTLFYLNFLKVNHYSPRLAKISRINIFLPLLLLPSCFFALPYAHTLATICITIWLTLALICGIYSYQRGFRPARYFILAFIALWIPGLIILPANIGLIPDLIDNSELFTLLGGTADAILLAFALADRIRLLSKERESALAHAEELLELAATDHLTGLGNRYAFEMYTEEFQCGSTTNPKVLALIDLDGLKYINDEYGHAHGDQLLIFFADQVKPLISHNVTLFRLGGDEFAFVADQDRAPQLITSLTILDTHIKQNGFIGAGVSFGIAHCHEAKTISEWLALADKRMYEHKTEKHDRVVRQRRELFGKAPC